MSGSAAVGRRRDTSAARAALARRRQRAAHALQPNNTSNTSNAPVPPIPKKANNTVASATARASRTTIQRRTTKTTSGASDPAGSSKYLSPDRPNSLNAAARDHRQPRLSPPGQRNRISSHGTATTSSLTVESSVMAHPPSINRANRSTAELPGSSPLKGTPSRSPQKVIHYTTQPKEKEILDTSASKSSTNTKSTRIAPTPITTTTTPAKTTAASTPTNTRTATRTSSAVLNARLKARYQSPSHARGKGLPPKNAANDTGVKEPAPVKSNNPRPPPASTSKTLKRPTTKPPVALNMHVANKPPMAKRTNAKNLTINTSAAKTSATATNTSRVLAASPRRSAVRDRMNQSTNDTMTPSAANTSKRLPTPTNIPITASQSSPNKRQPQTSPSKKSTPLRSSITPKRQQQMSQRLAQRAIEANRPKTIPNVTEPATKPQRVSPPKEFGSISTFLMNDMSMLDTSTNNLLDTTLPPVNTPTNALNNNNNAANQSLLLEDLHKQTMEESATWNLDASCLKHHSEIMLRSCCNGKTIQRERDLPDDQIDDSAVECRALCLGTPEEALSIDKVDSTSPELRHGDVIRILGSSGSHAMGAYRNERYGLELLFLPLFSLPEREEEEDCLWQVFLAEPTTKILVGRAAVEPKTHSTKLTKPIRASVPILLRHVTSGGVLSISDHGSLTLLTDSFGQQQQSQIIQAMDQLQHHDKLVPSKNQTFQFLPLASPPCPTWAVSGNGETESCLDERLFLTSSYLLHPKRLATKQMELSQQDRMEMTSQKRERILMEEVIGSFLGLEGRHIRMKQQGDFGFHLSGTDGIDFEMSLHHLVEQILPMSTSYIKVQHFCTSHHPGYNHGRVMQAFCEGLDTLLQDYVDFVVQLELQHRNKTSSSECLLTMKNIFFQISPWLHSMSILEHAIRAVRDTKGGALINALWSLERHVYMGDTVAKKVLGILLEKASMPYLDMMAEWLESGRLNDPFQEFMVQHESSNEFNATQFDGDDWMAMFGIDETNILEGVTSDAWTKEKILTTGKYWNAVHACQVDVEAFLDGTAPTIPKLPFHSDSSAIVAYIDSMYQSASKVLVKLMKEKFKLTESMDVMKRYFLLDQGDFVMNFLDAAEDELRKKASDVSVGRVQNWLNASIQLTEQHRNNGDEEEANHALVPQALRCRFSAKSLTSFLESRYGHLTEKMPLTPSRNAYPESTSGSSGIEVFVIDFSYIPFPISLVLSNHAMDKYKLLFRHLLFTKHVERRLIRVWRDHQILKKLGALRGLLGPTFLLRQRMLHFVQNFLYYMSFEVIDNNWTEMMNSIESDATKDNKQQTVDDILQVHDAFLERTLEACLLTNRDLVQSLTKLMNTVLLFTNQMKRFMDATRIHDDSTILAAEKQLTVQRNLNERGITPGGTKKFKTIRRELMSTKKEREALNDRQTRRVGREVISESYQKMVARFGEVFNADVSEFMIELNGHTASGLVANLGVRLDYNGFVTSSIR